MYDILIRGGRIVDGTGSPARPGNVAVKDGIIVAVGVVDGPAREVIEANGALVTPGFIDVHTHYDGQFLWDDKLDPSFSNGVTTAIAGNCGVGFAPARPEHRKALIDVLTSGSYELGGLKLTYGPNDNQGSDTVFLTIIDKPGHFKAVKALGGTS